MKHSVDGASSTADAVDRVKSKLASMSALSKQKQIDKCQKRLRNIARLEDRVQKYGKAALSEEHEAMLLSKKKTQKKLQYLMGFVPGDSDDENKEPDEGDVFLDE